MTPMAYYKSYRAIHGFQLCASERGWQGRGRNSCDRKTLPESEIFSLVRIGDHTTPFLKAGQKRVCQIIGIIRSPKLWPVLIIMSGGGSFVSNWLGRYYQKTKYFENGFSIICLDTFAQL